MPSSHDLENQLPLETVELRQPTTTDAPIGTKELRDLRHKYKAAYTTYMLFVHKLSDSSERGVPPNQQTLEEESAAFTSLALVRHELLEALKGR